MQTKRGLITIIGADDESRVARLVGNLTPVSFDFTVQVLSDFNVMRLRLAIIPAEGASPRPLPCEVLINGTHGTAADVGEST